MNPLGIREVIDAALQAEEKGHQLRATMERRLPELRGKLVIPENDPIGALMDFVVRYVRSVPSCLRLVTAVSKRLGFFDYAAPFLHMAEDYFLQPPGELPQDGGLEALLDEAFLAHRLLEEVNDHHIRHLQRALLPVDMTEANIIVHHLLGDEFALRLEELVQFTASQLLRQEHVWVQVKALTGAQLDSPPLSLTEDAPVAAIRLRLAS